jgi:hypothetical protein
MADEMRGIDETMAGVPETMKMGEAGISQDEKMAIMQGSTLGFGDEEIQNEIAKILRRDSSAAVSEVEKSNPSLIENAIRNLSGSSIGNNSMPMMDDEEKRVFTELLERGIPEDMIIDIMASAKVGATIPATAVNPAEFGGLPKTGSSPASGNPSIPAVGGAVSGAGASMNQNDMAMYLQNKVKEIKDRTGGSMGALSGVPAGNQTPMVMPKPIPAVMPQRLGADRTFNPMDRLTPTNAPNT